MQNSELINDLENGDGSDNVIVISEDNVYNIESVTNVDGSIIITIQPILDTESGSTTKTGGTSIGGCSGNLVDNALDVFGDLSNIDI